MLAFQSRVALTGFCALATDIRLGLWVPKLSQFWGSRVHSQLQQLSADGRGLERPLICLKPTGLGLTGFPEIAARLRDAYKASGYRGAMRKVAEEFEHLQATNQVFMPINVAGFYAAAGEKERAFYWLEQAYKHRGHGSAGISMVFLNRDPGLEPLRSDPRYKDLLRRVGLPPCFG